MGENAVRKPEKKRTPGNMQDCLRGERVTEGERKRVHWNVLGNVLGSVRGKIRGNVHGNALGSVQGNVQGNV